MRWLRGTNKFRVERFLARRHLQSRRSEAFISFVTALSIAGIALALCALVVVMAVMEGFGQEFKARIIGLGAQLQIEKFSGLRSDDQISQVIAAQDQVLAVAPFLRGQTLHVQGNQFTALSVLGLDLAQERQTTQLASYLISPNITLRAGQIIIGQELANYLGYQPGDKIRLLSPQTRQSQTFTITGLFYTGMFNYDFNYVLLNLEEAGNLLNCPGRIHGLKIKLRPHAKLDHVKTSLQDQLGFLYQVHTWQDLNRSLVGALKVEKKIMFIILSLLIIVACFNIAATLIMSVMEKTKEVGILNALGFSPQRIRRLFLVEGLMIGSIGTALGISLGLLLTLNLNALVNFLEQVAQITLFPQDIYYLEKIPVHLSFKYLISLVGYSMVLSILAAFYPAWRASRLDPVEAIRYE
jgi:lipoprotein-releasing system permease protein